ncbi:hypothetical protein BLA29_015223 [Euroglyphus maynei]|uniref:Uncharacterized protein n=1 Tax=Euroglyphus maynei TaxID=6958 RepID=A0A1Y3ARX9_EURMA|nr:hypothetical protein BLA29_015223 [Euroglyphus maynei]
MYGLNLIFLAKTKKIYHSKRMKY